jgi:zinc protease
MVMTKVNKVILIGLTSGFASLNSYANLPKKELSIAQQMQFPVEKFELKNGLKVLLIEDHAAPLISVQVGFRVGSKDENLGATGLAHLFEHMMFKGAKRYPGNQIESVMQKNGGVNNAYTTQDETVYYENFPSSKLELMLDIESDRMVNLKINEAQLNSEREVVKEERRMRLDNNPMGKMYNAMFEHSFRSHPYRWPVIGSMKDLNDLTINKCQDFYQMYYAPNNAVLVIAGDFEKENAKKLVARYFEPLKAQNVVRKTHPPEPEQTAERIHEIREEVQSTTVNVSYVTTKVGTKDAYALDVLAVLLGDGDSSRLHKSLVYHQPIATSASVSAPSLVDSGLIYFFANLKPGISYRVAEERIQTEITKAQKTLFTQSELQRAKNQIMMSYVSGLKKISGKARMVMVNEIKLGDYTALFDDLAKYEQVTVNDLQFVAKKYLQPQKRTIIRVLPSK